MKPRFPTLAHTFVCPFSLTFAADVCWAPYLMSSRNLPNASIFPTMHTVSFLHVGTSFSNLNQSWKHFKQINYQENFFPLLTRCEWPQRYHCCWFGDASNFHQIGKLSSEESVSCRDKVCSETCALVSWMDSAHIWVAHILQEPHWEFKRAILSSLSMMF